MSHLVQTLLFTDVVGSTERLVELGDAGWSALLARHHREIRLVLRTHGGREVDTAGDGFMARFDAPAPAVRAAHAAITRVASLGLQIRTGLHTGEVEVDDAAVAGRAVHLAARVMAMAEPGEVLVSSTVRDVLAGSTLRFMDKGVHQLKGFAEPWRLYRLDRESDADPPKLSALGDAAGSPGPYEGSPRSHPRPVSDAGIAPAFSPPSGTVSFLFTDVESSTVLWEANPAKMEIALQRHDGILLDAIERHGGYVFSTAGDSFAAAFPRVGDAIGAAVEAQDALAAERWPDETLVRVRMGVHTGEAQERAGNYFGPTVNRAARLMSAAHGGQVVVSGVSAALTDTGGLTCVGRYRLKDLNEPEVVWQVGSKSFPALRTVDAVRHNLPVRRSPLVGRDEDLEVVAERLAEHRLVTVTGVGGVGKTSLAVAVAGSVIDQFPDGVFLAELAPVSDARSVARAVAEAAGMRVGDVPSDQLGSVVTTFLGSRQVLLIVDNCEHVLDAAADLVDGLLTAGAECSVLATSREPLEVAGEQVIRIGPLATGPAVSLLVERIAAVRGDFRPCPGDRAALARICDKLDGIPLALELAAAQLAHLAPGDLLARLSDRFRLLGARHRRGSRQETLAAVMRWSWDLLTPHQQMVLSELSIFTPGWDLLAAEAICTAGSEPTAVTIGDLFAKSLVVRSDDEGAIRYGMLETVRLFALERLVEAGREAELRGRHARYWSRDALPPSFAQREAPDPFEPFARLRRDGLNAQAAAEWLIQRGEADAAVPLAAALGFLWHMGLRASTDRTIEVLSAVLDAELDNIERAYALIGVAHWNWGVGNWKAVGERAAEAYELAVGENDHAAAAVTSWLQAAPHQVRDPHRALRLNQQAEMHATEAQAPTLLRSVRGFSSLVHSLGLGDPDTAIAICHDALAGATSSGYDRLVILTSLVTPLYLKGEWKAAAAINKEVGSLYKGAFFETVEQAVVAAELGEDFGLLYRAAYEWNQADGTTTNRPEHLLVPLGRAVRGQDWQYAAAIVATIRGLSRQGVDFQSPGMVALYLHYKQRVQRQQRNSHWPEPLPFQDIVDHELAQDE